MRSSLHLRLPLNATRTEARKLVALSVPAMATQAGTMLLGVVDTMMVGHVGP
jgi:Na+-driven multidrug efflux pump